MGGSAGSSSVQAAKRLCKLAPASFPRPRTASPTRRRRGNVLPAGPAAPPSSGEGSEEDHVDAVTVAALEPASTPAASRQQRCRADSLGPPHEACTVAGTGDLEKLAARKAPGGRRGGDGRGTDSVMRSSQKTAPTSLKCACALHGPPHRDKDPDYDLGDLEGGGREGGRAGGNVVVPSHRRTSPPPSPPASTPPSPPAAAGVHVALWSAVVGGGGCACPKPYPPYAAPSHRRTSPPPSPPASKPPSPPAAAGEHVARWSAVVGGSGGVGGGLSPVARSSLLPRSSLRSSLAAPATPTQRHCYSSLRVCRLSGSADYSTCSRCCRRQRPARLEGSASSPARSTLSSAASRRALRF